MPQLRAPRTGLRCAKKRAAPLFGIHAARTGRPFGRFLSPVTEALNLVLPGIAGKKQFEPQRAPSFTKNKKKQPSGRKPHGRPHSWRADPMCLLAAALVEDASFLCALGELCGSSCFPANPRMNLFLGAPALGSDSAVGENSPVTGFSLGDCPHRRGAQLEVQGRKFAKTGLIRCFPWISWTGMDSGTACA